MSNFFGFSSTCCGVICKSVISSSQHALRSAGILLMFSWVKTPGCYRTYSGHLLSLYHLWLESLLHFLDHQLWKCHGCRGGNATAHTLFAVGHTAYHHVMMVPVMMVPFHLQELVVSGYASCLVPSELCNCLSLR